MLSRRVCPDGSLAPPLLDGSNADYIAIELGMAQWVFYTDEARQGFPTSRKLDLDQDLLVVGIEGFALQALERAYMGLRDKQLVTLKLSRKGNNSALHQLGLRCLLDKEPDSVICLKEKGSEPKRSKCFLGFPVQDPDRNYVTLEVCPLEVCIQLRAAEQGPPEEYEYSTEEEEEPKPTRKPKRARQKGAKERQLRRSSRIKAL